MNTHFDTAGKQHTGYQQFKRWEWYNSTRLTPSGNIVDNFRMNNDALKTSTVARGAGGHVTEANTGSWTFLGPNDVNSSNKGIGRANRIAFHPTNPNTMYVAGATGGLWITTDNGANWYSYSEGIPNMCLSGVVVHPTNPNIIYILTGDGDATFGGAWDQFRYTKYSTGVLKSYDGGFTWYQTGLHWDETEAMVAYKLVIHPTQPDILMVATDDGIYRTTDGGNNWAQIENNIYFWDIEFHPTNPSIVYAVGNEMNVETRFYTSSNSGATFTETADFNWSSQSNWNRAAIAVSPNSSGSVFVLAGPATTTGNFRGFYRSTDGGDNFTLRTGSPNILGRNSLGNDAVDQERYDLCVAINPGNVNRIVTGGIRVWTSSNQGSSFAYQDNYVSSLDYYHDDIHDLVYHPTRSNEVWMCADGGVYRSLDNGGSWISVSGNLALTQYYKISANPASGGGNENVIIGGTQDNGTNKREISGGSTFNQIKGSDGMDCYIDPDNVSVYVVSIQDGEFYYSNNAGSSFETVCNPTTAGIALGTTVNGVWVTPVAEIAGTSLRFLIGYQPAVVALRLGANNYSFTNVGWSGRTFVKTARNNASRMYIGDNDFLNKNLIKTSTDGGNNWSTVLDENNFVPVTDLAFNPDNGNYIWITYGGYDDEKKVRYSSNGGSTWTNMTGSLPNVPVNCIVFDDNNGSPANAVYIGTDIGVFYRDDNLGDWIPYSNKLPVVEVTDLEIHETEGLLRAGTYGRGIWQSSLYNGCLTDVTLTTSNLSMFKPYYYQVSQTINSSAWHIGTGANVFYKAGIDINLTPGFIASPGPLAVFEARIGPCGGGVPGWSFAAPVPALKGFLKE
ncbi:MAG: 3-coathanger stack domain-containing protein [Ferruginibacter sp.]